MSSALVAQPRSLDLPLGALFSPIEMQIGPSTSQAEYQKLGAGLRKLDNASELWTADFSLFGVRTWGKEQGLQLAHDATGLSKFFLYKTSFVAARFTPEHRLPGYKYSAYRELMPFPPEWAYAFLTRHGGEKLSSRSLRALAVKEFGEEPYKAKQPKKRNVSIRSEIYARLAQHSASQKVASFIEQILEDWLRHSEGPPLTNAEKQRRYRERHPGRNAEIQKRWREQQGKPAATTYHDDKQHSEVSKVPVGARPSSGNDKQSTSAQPPTPAAPETPRPTYEERRKAQYAAGVQPVPKKRRVRARKYRMQTHALRLQWVPCSKKSSGDGAVRGANSQRADCFPTLEDAQAAEEKYFQEKGYRNEIIYCVVPCGAYHVKHAYSREAA
jgi:hypothetical protein